jgi:hypothetical protein
MFKKRAPQLTGPDGLPVVIGAAPIPDSSSTASVSAESSTSASTTASASESASSASTTASASGSDSTVRAQVFLSLYLRLMNF